MTSSVQQVDFQCSRTPVSRCKARRRRVSPACTSGLEAHVAVKSAPPSAAGAGVDAEHLAEQTPRSDVRGATINDHPARSGHRGLPLRRRALRIKRAPDRGRVLPLQDLPEKRRRPFQRIRELSRAGLRVHEGRASLLSHQQFRQTGILRRMRFADSLFFTKGIRTSGSRSDHSTIPRTGQ